MLPVNLRDLWGWYVDRRHLKAVPDLSSAVPRDAFMEAARQIPQDARVLEIGTLAAVEGQVKHSMSWFPQVPRGNYVLSDIEAGAGVDVVADVHRLPEHWSDEFNAFVAIAVFEHVERPWKAAHEIARVLAPGGIAYISTCQTFPLHAYPSDFFRFSAEALSLLMQDVGLEVVHVGYEGRAQIYAPTAFVPWRAQRTWNALWPSYLYVNVFARKPVTEGSTST